MTNLMREFPLRVSILNGLMAQAICDACKEVLLEYQYNGHMEGVYDNYIIARDAHVLTQEHEANMVLYVLGGNG